MILKKRKNISRFTNKKHDSDGVLLVVIGIIVIFGLTMLSSASSVLAYAKFKDSYYYFNHQLVILIFGFFVFLFFSKMNYHVWKKYAGVFYIGSLILLMLVFIPSLSVGYGTANSWIKVFGSSLQPSEFVKVSFLIYLASWVDKKEKVINTFSDGVMPFMVILGFISVLLMLQPDLGTLFIIGCSAMAVFFVGGAKLSHVLVILLLPIVFLIFVLNTNAVHRFDYVRNRFKCVGEHDFTDRDACYQINQSLIAIGSGGLYGRGIGQSKQKYLYLPEVNGDSIFPIIAEEIGFIFSSILLLFYFILFYRGIIIAKNSPDNFGRYLSVGIVSWIMAQIFLNVGGMIGIIPMTGVPLPLVSQGGSSVLSILLGLGIITNISKYS